MYLNLVAIAIGSVLGGWLRWFIGLKLNALWGVLPIGTLLVNLLGGLCIGFACSYFNHSDLSPAARLLVMTGFCGGLTTFSTFSLEVLTLLGEGRYASAGLSVALHVLGALGMTCLGFYCHQHYFSQVLH